MRRRRPQPIALPGMEAALAPRRSGAVRACKTGKGPSPAPRPWEAVVLGVDTARRSGWAIYVRGQLLEHGELDTLQTEPLRLVVRKAARLAEHTALPCVLVLERPWGGNVHVVAGLGAARERWLNAWRVLASGHVGKVVTVQPGTWRAAVLGAQSVGMDREQVRELEQLTARAFVGRDVGPDEAPAILIGRWGAQAGEVGKHLGKRAKAASMAAWLKGRGGRFVVDEA